MEIKDEREITIRQIVPVNRVLDIDRLEQLPNDVDLIVFQSGLERPPGTGMRAMFLKPLEQTGSKMTEVLTENAGGAVFKSYAELTEIVERMFPNAKNVVTYRRSGIR